MSSSCSSAPRLAPGSPRNCSAASAPGRSASRSCALTVVAVTFGVRSFLVHVSGWDRETAFFAAVPGALSYVIAVAATTGADIRKVAVSQSIRIFLLVAALPAIVIAIEGGPPSGQPVTTASWQDLALLVVVSAVVGFAFRYLRVPAGLLTGSFAASAFLHGSGLVEGHAARAGGDRSLRPSRGAGRQPLRRHQPRVPRAYSGPVGRRVPGRDRHRRGRGADRRRRRRHRRSTRRSSPSRRAASTR